MIVFPNCKINLGLRILRKRKDGFHDLETIFYPLPFTDVLEIIRYNSDQLRVKSYELQTEDYNINCEQIADINFSSSGLSINGNSADNLCLKAYQLLKTDFPGLPPVQLHLHKAIPIGAGLGGGSADAAFTLKLLAEKFKLNLSTNQLIQYSLQLGSDCPFFIINKPCAATGRGEIMEQLPIDLSAYKFIIVNPGIHINTAKAFAGITPALPANSVKQIIQQPIETWKAELINDFEKSVFVQHPEIETIKNKLYEAGAIYSSMSGSGSTVYGIFEKENETIFDFPAHYFSKELYS